MTIYNVTAGPILQWVNNPQNTRPLYERRIYATGNLALAAVATFADLAIGAFAKLGAAVSNRRSLHLFAAKQYKGSFNRIKSCWNAVYNPKIAKEKKLAWGSLTLSSDIIREHGCFIGDFFITQDQECKYIIYNIKTKESSVVKEVIDKYAIENDKIYLLTNLNKAIFTLKKGSCPNARSLGKKNLILEEETLHIIEEGKREIIFSNLKGFFIDNSGNLLLYKKDNTVEIYGEDCTTLKASIPNVTTEDICDISYNKGLLYIQHPAAPNSPLSKIQIIDTKKNKTTPYKKTTQYLPWCGNQHIAFFPCGAKEKNGVYYNKMEIYNPKDLKAIITTIEYEKLFETKNYFILSKRDPETGSLIFDVYKDDMMQPKQTLKLENVKKYERKGDRVVAELNDGTFQTLLLD